MNLQENIKKVLHEETHAKIKSYIKESFNERFDRLNLIPKYEQLSMVWVDENGEKMFSRNWWGVFWIYNCEIYKDLKNVTLLFSMNQEEFETNLLEYLNTKYKKEFEDRPLKQIGDEYFCLEDD